MFGLSSNDFRCLVFVYSRMWARSGIAASGESHVHNNLSVSITLFHALHSMDLLISYGIRTQSSSVNLLFQDRTDPPNHLTNVTS